MLTINYNTVSWATLGLGQRNWVILVKADGHGEKIMNGNVLFFLCQNAHT